MTRYVYVAGPLTGPDAFSHVRRAVQAGESLRQAGFVPFVPHLLVLHEMIVPHVGYEDYMAMDFAWIERCDALLRLPGPSKGSDREVAFALSKGIPVFYSVEDLAAFASVKFDD